MKTILALAAAIPLFAAAQTNPPPAGWTTEPSAAPPPAAQPAQPPAPPAYPPAQPAYPPQPQAAPPAQPAYAPAQPAPVYARPAQQRDRWYIGFGLAAGGGNIKIPNESSMSFEDYVGPDPMQAALNFKVGATLSPKLLLGLDITAFRSQAESGGDSAGAQVSTYNVMATFFPMERGFFFRAGVGIARFTYDADIGGYKFNDDTSGVNLQAGGGYAFWLGQQFNLTVNLDFATQSYGDPTDTLGLLPKSTNFWALGVGCDWY